MLKYLKKCLSKKYTLILVLIFILQNIKDECEKNNFEIKSIEGLRNSKWLLIDLGDIVCHIFEAEERESYNLEKLWSDMPTIDIKEYLA